MQNLLELKPTMDDIERLQPFVAQTAEKAGIVGREAKRLRPTSGLPAGWASSCCTR